MGGVSNPCVFRARRSFRGINAKTWQRLFQQVVLPYTTSCLCQGRGVKTGRHTWLRSLSRKNLLGWYQDPHYVFCPLDSENHSQPASFFLSGHLKQETSKLETGALKGVAGQAPAKDSHPDRCGKKTGDSRIPSLPSLFLLSRHCLPLHVFRDHARGIGLGLARAKNGMDIREQTRKLEDNISM